MEIGLTNFEYTPFKIWINTKIEKIQCPFCKEIYFDNVDDLEKHLLYRDNHGSYECIGRIFYGMYGISNIINEIKYYRLKEEYDDFKRRLKPNMKKCFPNE